jgi:hypothetical protein
MPLTEVSIGSIERALGLVAAPDRPPVRGSVRFGICLIASSSLRVLGDSRLPLARAPIQSPRRPRAPAGDGQPHSSNLAEPQGIDDVATMVRPHACTACRMPWSGRPGSMAFEPTCHWGSSEAPDWRMDRAVSRGTVRRLRPPIRLAQVARRGPWASSRAARRERAPAFQAVRTRR